MDCNGLLNASQSVAKRIPMSIPLQKICKIIILHNATYRIVYRTDCSISRKSVKYVTFYLHRVYSYHHPFHSCLPGFRG